MDEKRWQQIEQLFFEVAEAEPADRASKLDELCPGDAALRAKLEAMLEAAEAEPKLGIESRLLSRGEDRPPSNAAGTVIGAWELGEPLGKGGMGEVYVARRADGEFQQTVALKLISGAIPGAQAIRRFKAERQILARLNHPNIARLIDGGTTPEGRPYLAMQLVDGIPITEYCADRSVEETLDVFATVCEAVAYAHRSLVIHRDLKPSNILVSSDGVVKLLDFGIAKLLSDEEDLTLAETRTGALVMTPETAAPEQIAGEPVTTATDVYVLGVLLHRLLSGASNPYDLDSPSRHELERAILESEPTRPSAAAEAARGRSLRGDLDNIVMTSVRKEPERRYGSVRELADDVGRYQRHEPVLAAPDSFGYRSRKFVRRHRIPVAAASIVATLIVGFALVTAAQGRTIASERDRAESVVQMLVDLFQTNDPRVQAVGDSMTVATFLSLSEDKVLSDLEDQPDLQIRMKHVLGQVYAGRTQHREARELLEEALEQQRTTHGSPTELEAAIALDLGVSLRELEGSRAEPFLRESLALQRAVHGESDPAVARAMTDLGTALEEREDRIALLEQALVLRRSMLPAAHPDIAASLDKLAVERYLAGEHAESVTLWTESLEMLERLHPRTHPNIISVQTSLASAYGLLGDVERSTELNLELLDRKLEVFGEYAQPVATSYNNLATNYVFLHDYPSAEASFRRALEIFQRIFGEDQGQFANRAQYANAARNIAITIQYQGRFAEALEWMETAIRSQISFAGEDAEQTLRMRVQRGNIFNDMGNPGAARDTISAMLSKLVAIARDQESRFTAEARLWLGRAYVKLQNPELALPHLERAVAFREQVYGPVAPITGEVQAVHALARHAVDPDGARADLNAAYDRYRTYGNLVPTYLSEIEAALEETDP